MTMLSTTTLLFTCPRGWECAARQEVRRILPGARVESLYIGGNLIAVCDEPREEVLTALREAKTWTLAHITPVQLRVSISAARQSLAHLRTAARHLPPPASDRTFRVACDRRGEHHFTSAEVERAIAGALIHEGRPPVDLESPEQVLSVEIFQDLAFLGMNAARDLLRKELRRMRRWAPGERPISRAELKLREAISRFGLALPAGGRALDLGAAPGGWTRVLAERMAEVVAVDPGDLDPRVLALPNVVHLPARIEELSIAELGRFDVLTNDMNLHPATSARLMVQVAGLVVPGGLAIMTVKFVTRRRRQHVREALEVLEAAYEDFQVGAVPHNALETTLVMRRRAAGSGER